MIDSKPTINPGDASLLARELDAVLRAAEYIEDADATLLLGAGTRLAKQLIELTERVEVCYSRYWNPEEMAMDEVGS